MSNESRWYMYKEVEEIIGVEVIQGGMYPNLSRRRRLRRVEEDQRMFADTRRAKDAVIFWTQS